MIHKMLSLPGNTHVQMELLQEKEQLVLVAYLVPKHNYVPLDLDWYQFDNLYNIHQSIEFD